MKTSPSFDRQLLGESGLALDDDIYVKVVAALGFSSWSWTSDTLGELRRLRWTPQNFQNSQKVFGARPPLQSLSSYAKTWEDHLKDATDRNIMLDAADFDMESPDLFAVARILNHPAVGAESVLIERRAPQADLRWQWPLRIAALPGDLEMLELAKLGGLGPGKSLVEVQALTREEARCEVLVIPRSVREGLRQILELPYHVRACHVLLLGPTDITWLALKGHADALLAETQAAALSLVSFLAAASVSDHLNTWITKLSHNTLYDLAVAHTFPRESSLHLMDLRLLEKAALPAVARVLARRLRRLPEKVNITLPEETAGRVNVGWTRAEPPERLARALETGANRLPFDHESSGGVALSDIAKAERAARRDSSPGEERRFLQGDLVTFSEGAWVTETRGFALGSNYRFDVFIGPKVESALIADKVFPEDKLDWSERDSITLQVLFVEPQQWDEPLKGILQLPRKGTSSKCHFAFSTTKAGPFAGRVIVYYRGRVLQTALLEAVVTEKPSDWATLPKPPEIRFSIEAEIRRSLGTLDDRRRFDACIVSNHTTSGTSGTTVAGQEGAYIASMDNIPPQLSAINGLLNQVALNTARYSKGMMSKENAKLLCDLAAEGNILYRNLVIDYICRSSAAEALRNAEYLQIVTAKPDAIVPLEFVYAYAPPLENAPVCKNALQALKDGRCPSGCMPKQSPASHVCPLGFWGLSKVIERHMHDPNLPKAATVLSEPIAGRDVLSLEGPSLLAASKQVPEKNRGMLKKVMSSAWHGDVADVESWDDWRKVIADKKPVLLLALPHAEGTGPGICLEISGNVLKGIYINEDYVIGDPERKPVMLLLGCDTADVAYTDAYARHIEVFRQAQAALVLGTVATVLGADAAEVAALLVERLSTAAKKSSERFGEVLRQVKREAVSDSVMMAMCLVAFGDADWQLK